MITKAAILKVILLTTFLVWTQLATFSQIDARLLRYPDVSETDIVFSYASDLWVVSKEGGVARHLTSPQGEEISPKFSPDGKTIAFSGNYDGNTDIYVISKNGGIPFRVTHHPDRDCMIDWYADNEGILYKSRMGCSTNKTNILYKTSRKGGFPQKLPVEIGEEATLSPDGKYLALNMMPLVYGGAWKRYRGGAASEIWLFNLETYESKNISNYNGDDKFPMWHGDNIYFLSDRDENKKANIWVYNTKSKEIKQITFFTKYDTHYPSLGPKDIVFENGGKLYLLNLENEEASEVSVKIQFNNINLKPKQKDVSDFIRNISLSPTGKRVVVEARGELFSLPANEGAVLNLTNTSGIAERYPAWSPDGKYLTYFTDRKGEYQLALKTKDGKEQIITTLEKGYRFQPHWSPNSKKIVFADNKMNINLYDIESGKISIIDKCLWISYYGLSAFNVEWSFDSKWICWSRGLENRNNGIFIYNVKQKKLYQATSGYYDDSDPVFDKEGKYLIYLSKRTLNSYNSDIQPTWIFANTTNIVAVPLTKNIKSPLVVKNDEEVTEEKQETGKINNIKIDFNNFEERAVILPPKAGNYSGLKTVKDKIIYIKYPETGSSDKESELIYFSINKQKESEITKGVRSYAISSDGKKLLVGSKGKYGVINLAANQKIEKMVPTDDIEMQVNPKEEWMQMYNEAWRYMRDFFYDENMHGTNWDEVGEKYRSLITEAGSREDVGFILIQLVGEVGAGHVSARGGDIQSSDYKGVGLLGVDFSLENGAYRIKKIYNSGYRAADYRPPLSEPGLNVKVGDYILAVNGLPLSVNKDPWASFIGLDDKTVILTINNSPEIKGSREIVVRTLRSAGKLRELDWVRLNREKVLKASNGRIGYIYVTNTSRVGQQELVRQFKAQFNMEGLIIDERFNAGGALGDRFVELLNRPLYGYLAVRNGKHFHMPEVAHPGPMALITNGWAASGGDGFPYFFQKAGLGPIIGQATMGALVGPNQHIPMIDGGTVSAPPSRIYNMKGEWDGAQTGVIPDIKILNDPESMANGNDKQLEKAIEFILSKLENKGERQPTPELLNPKWR